MCETLEYKSGGLNTAGEGKSLGVGCSVEGIAYAIFEVCRSVKDRSSGLGINLTASDIFQERKGKEKKWEYGYWLRT